MNNPEEHIDRKTPMLNVISREFLSTGSQISCRDAWTYPELTTKGPFNISWRYAKFLTILKVECQKLFRIFEVTFSHQVIISAFIRKLKTHELTRNGHIIAVSQEYCPLGRCIWDIWCAFCLLFPSKGGRMVERVAHDAEYWAATKISLGFAKKKIELRNPTAVSPPRRSMTSSREDF